MIEEQYLNEVNKKLIEICEIKPYYGLFVETELGNTILVTDKRKYRLIADCRGKVEDDDLRNLEAKYFPNFYDFNTFFTLMEIPIQDETILSILFSLLHETPKYCSDLIKILVKYLTKKGEYAKEIKQKIREFDWSF